MNISSFLPLGRVYTRPAGRRNFRGSSYSVRGIAQPMGVAEYKFMREVPESLETGLRSFDQI
ncbi:hypothetical protein GCT19_38130 [Paraburkholderia sp. CNPSo 3155]|nr:hypothetical protein [Paraburkholderia atlantica]